MRGDIPGRRACNTARSCFIERLHFPKPVTQTMPYPSVIFRLAAAALVVSAIAQSAFAQQTPTATTPALVEPTVSGYNQPSKAILDVMLAPSLPIPVVAPSTDRALLVTYQDYPSIARVATPFLRLAGVRVEPANRSRHDTPGGYGIPACATHFDLVQFPDSVARPVALPAGVCATRPHWSADGKRFAFENVTAHSVDLWVGDAITGAVHRIPGVQLNPMFGDELNWMPDQTTLLVKLVPAHSGPAPTAAAAADEPQHPGNRRPERPEQHLRGARHAEQRQRRSAVRLLRELAACARRRWHGQAHAARRARAVRRPCARAGRTSSAGLDDPAALFVRHDRRALPARLHGVGHCEPHAHCDAPHHVAPLGGPGADCRRAARTAQFFVAADRTGHAHLGRSARRRRLERRGARTRQGHDAQGAVRRRAA